MPPPLQHLLQMKGGQRKRRLLLALLLITIIPLILFGVYRGVLRWQVSRQLAAIKASGAPATLNDLALLYPEISPSENGAILLTNAFAGLLPVSTNFTFSARQRLPNDTLAHFSEVLNSNKLSFELLDQALKFQKFRYAIDVTNGYFASLPHLVGVKTMGQTLRAKSFCTSENGAAEECVKSITDSFLLRETIRREPNLIAHLVAISMTGVELSALEKALNSLDLSYAQLESLQNAFAKAQDLDALRFAMWAERCTGIDMFQNDRSFVRFLSEEGDTSFGSEMSAKGTFWLYRLSGQLDRDFLVYLSFFSRADEACGVKYPIRLDQSDRVFDVFNQQTTNKWFVLSRSLFPALKKCAWRDAEAIARLRVGETGLAVEKFRRQNHELPPQLADLVPKFINQVPEDPYDGKPLRFKRLPKGFVIYSVGGDRTDQGGKEKPARTPEKPNNVQSGYDVTLTVER